MTHVLDATGQIKEASTGSSGITDLTGDVSATGPGSVAATVNTVGGASAANVADAVTKRHTQNTDTGTTSTTFQVDSAGSGPKIKNNAGALEVRNATDSADAYLHAAGIKLSASVFAGGFLQTDGSGNVTIVVLSDSDIPAIIQEKIWIGMI